MNDTPDFVGTHRALPRVKITAVETVPLQIPFRTKQKKLSVADRTSHEIMIVRIKTDAGLEGIGETYARRRQGVAETLVNLKHAIETYLAPQLIGADPFAFTRLLSLMDDALDRSYAAKAALSDALLDLIGKLLNTPVSTLFGGRQRATVATCAVLNIKDRWEDTSEEVERYAAEGYASYTIKVGISPEADFNNVRRIRERLPNAILRVDANARLDFDSALSLLKRIEPFGIDAAEQPLALWDIAGMAELARRVDTPITADECVTNRHDLINVVRQRAASVIQTKVAKNGGLWECAKLWTIAEAAGMRIYPGNFPSTSVSTSSVLQLASAWSGPLLDGSFAYGLVSALAQDIVINPLAINGPDISVPEGPGFGVTLDEDALRLFRVDG